MTSAEHHLRICGLNFNSSPVIQSSSGSSSVNRITATEFQLLLHTATRSNSPAPSILPTAAEERLQHCCLLLGLPSELTQEDLLLFLEPFLCDITSITLIEVVREGMVALPEKCSIAQFSSAAPQSTFLGIYNNLHFPGHRDNPPCIVMILHSIQCVADSSSSSSSSNNNNDIAQPSRSCAGSEIRLPSCSICLRRIKSSESKIAGVNDIALGRYDRRRADRCVVCHLLSCGAKVPLQQQQQQQQTDAVVHRYCSSCRVTDNLWLCLACGHCGCGRYTLQHAQSHYTDTSAMGAPHIYSLEVASGRIWNYSNDAFVHDEQLLSDNLCFSDPEESSTYLTAVSHEHEFIKPVTPRRPVKSLSGGYSYNNSNTQLIDERNLHDQKIASVISRYEDILESQLADQRIHYQKQLAQETIRAANSTHSTSGAVVTDEDMQMFESRKIDISILESETIATMKLAKEIEVRIAILRKENDEFLSEQKGLKNQILQIIMKEKEVSDAGNQAVMELEDQIMDLSFYQKTTKQIAGASDDTREALSTGTMIIARSPHGEAINSVSSRGGNRGDSSNGKSGTGKHVGKKIVR